ncbi:MAG: Uma2 family endonuclease [Myxococcota bacterium]
MESLDPDRIHYPESDGRPMADNTVQFRWIVVLKENLDALLPDFVGGDLLWYPVLGNPKVRVAPDVLVALGRPKGDRGSYRQWEEAHVAPQVVMEVLSPSNTVREMFEKLGFFDRYGVSEFYLLDPDEHTLQVFVRSDGGLREVLHEAPSDGWGRGENVLHPGSNRPPSPLGRGSG